MGYKVTLEGFGRTDWKEFLRSEGSLLLKPDVPSLNVRAYLFETPSLSIGRLFRIPDDLEEPLKNTSLPVWRRMTGGGIAFHGKDLVFSLSLPTKDVYGNVSYFPRTFANAVQQVLRESGFNPVWGRIPGRKSPFCLLSESERDLFIDGWKVFSFAGIVRRDITLFHFQLCSLPVGEWSSSILSGGAKVPDFYGKLASIVGQEEFVRRVVTLFENILFCNVSLTQAGGG